MKFSKLHILFSGLLLLLFKVNGLSAQPAEIVEGVPLRIYNAAITSRSTMLEPGTVFELFINYENTAEQKIVVAEVMLKVPNGITLITNDGIQLVENVPSKNTSGVNYVIAISRLYDKYQLPIEVFISDREGSLVRCYQIMLYLGQNANSSAKATKISGKKSESIVEQQRQDNVLGDGEHNDASVTSRTVRSTADNKVEKWDRYVVIGKSLNVRKSPSVESMIVGKVTMGDTVLALEPINGWCEIKFNGHIAFVSEKYIRKAEGRQDVGKNSAKSEFVFTKAEEDFYKPLSTNTSETVETLGRGDELPKQVSQPPISKSSDKESVSERNNVSSDASGKSWFGLGIGACLMSYNSKVHFNGITFSTAGGPLVLEHLQFGLGISWMYQDANNVTANTLAFPISIGYMDTPFFSIKGGFMYQYLLNMKYDGSRYDLSNIDRGHWAAFIRVTLLVFYYQCDFSLSSGQSAMHTVGLSFGF